MPSSRRPVVVIAGAVQPSPALAAAARALGRALVHAGHRLATGGPGGILEAA